MAWSLDRKKLGSLNDSAFRQLPVGTHKFRITEFVLAPVKDDASGRKKQVNAAFEYDNVTYRASFATDHDNETVAEIAGKTVIAICDACGVEKVDSAGLKKCVGQYVLLTVDERQGKGANADKKFSNIKTVDAVTDEAETESVEDEAEAEDEDGEEEDEDDTEDGEEEEQSKAPAKRRPWG